MLLMLQETLDFTWDLLMFLLSFWLKPRCSYDMYICTYTRAEGLGTRVFEPRPAVTIPLGEGVCFYHHVFTLKRWHQMWCLISWLEGGWTAAPMRITHVFFFSGIYIRGLCPPNATFTPPRNTKVLKDH